MLKYSVTFSSNHNSLEKSEEEVRELMVKLLESARIDGATLTKNLAGVWQGETEDSYSLSILSDTDISVKVEALALNLKASLKQFSVMIEQTTANAKFL